ncbi:MAG: histidinol-phosphatase [Planctomycetaceae bacterium]|nr:histidinol-phosphatase [Planctomycetaceae bacterium]
MTAAASATDIQARLDLALSAGREAAAITLNYFRQDNFEIELKADSSPVTVADRQAEEHLRQRILATFPHDAILGEEFPAVAGTSGYRWILDPIDGTKSFVHGVPFYGTMIGVEYEPQPAGASARLPAEPHVVIGVVFLPGLDEVVYASRGHGTWLIRGSAAPQRCQVSKCANLSDALFLTTSVQAFEKLGRREAYDGIAREARLTRTWGDCYGYLMVATGRAEVMVDPIMNLWDAAAVQPIVEEAGGTFTDWQGKHTVASGEGVATNGLVLESVVAHTRGR